MPIAMLATGGASGSAILVGSGPVEARRDSHYRLEEKRCDRIVPLGFLFRVFRVAHAWTSPRSTAARAIAVSSRRFKKSILLTGVQLRLERTRDEGHVRESSRLNYSACATAVEVALHRNAIPVGFAPSRRIRIEERRLPPAIAWVRARSGRFGERRDGLSSLLFPHVGRPGGIRAPEGV